MIELVFSTHNTEQVNKSTERDKAKSFPYALELFSKHQPFSEPQRMYVLPWHRQSTHRGIKDMAH
jgi:hypothetical protein